MGKHTPGPWRLWADGDEDQFPHVMSEDGYAICDLCDWGSLEIEEQEANSLLILQSPDMLAALKDAHPHIADDALRTRIGNIIAKAEGLTP